MPPSTAKRFTAEEDSKTGKRKKRRSPRLTGVSKQRKKANARERDRVSVLNNYIQILRTLIPQNGNKTTKFDVIVGATSYISQLSSILQGEDDFTVSKEMDAEDMVDSQWQLWESRKQRLSNLKTFSLKKATGWRCNSRDV